MSTISSPVSTSSGSYQSQVDQFNAISNPLWVSPYDNNWEEERCATVFSLSYQSFLALSYLLYLYSTEPSGTQVERDNPLYESQVSSIAQHIVT